MLAWHGFFFEKFNVWQPKRGPWSGPGRPRGPFPNFKGGPRDPKVARPLSKRGLGGALGPSRDEKHRNGDEQCVFKIVKIRLVFTAFLDRSLRQSVRNSTEGVQNRRSANRSETLASFRRAVGGPGSPRRSHGGSRGGPWESKGRSQVAKGSYNTVWESYFGSPISTGGGKEGVTPPLVIKSLNRNRQLVISHCSRS